MSSIKTEYRNEKGYLHREDGPAIEWNNGTKRWQSLCDSHEVSI